MNVQDNDDMYNLGYGDGYAGRTFDAPIDSVDFDIYTDGYNDGIEDRIIDEAENA